MPMPEKLKEYYDQLNKVKTKSPALTAMLQAIKNVNTAADKLRKPDRYKRIPYVVAEDRDKLMALHKAVGSAAETLLKSEQESPAVKDIVRKFSALASANYTRLGAYEPDKQPKTLDAIEEETRTMYLDHSSADLAGKKGNALSSRIPISFLNHKGEKVNGFFTAKKQLNVYDALSAKLREHAEKCTTERGKRFYRELLQKLEAQAKAGKLNTDRRACPGDREYALSHMFVTAIDEKDDDKIDAAKITQVIKDAFGEETKNMSLVDIANDIGADALTDLARDMEPYIAEVCINMRLAGIPDGSRIDSRNAAMSAVADLLHMPNVIARARPMVLRDKNGNEIEGTFMTEAQGEDVQNLSAAAAVDEKAFEGTDGKALRDIADLQVLDFICGNTDRHFANMFYQIGKNKKLLGVQGIDNDCSFGLFVPQDGGSHMRLTGLDNLRAVSESTYERVMALNGDALKYALRGFGLSDKELDAAAKRLELMQKALVKGVDACREADENRNEEMVVGNDDDFSFSYDEKDQKAVEQKLQEELQKGQEKAKKNANRLDKEGKPLPEILVPAQGNIPVFKKHLRVVPDSAFDRLKIDDLSVEQDIRTGKPADQNTPRRLMQEGNTFRAAYGGVACMGRDYRSQKRPKKIHNAPIMENKNRSDWKEIKSYREQADEFSEQLRQNTRTFHSNGKYRDMESAAKDYIKLMRRIEDRTKIANRDDVKDSPNYKMDVQAVVTPKDLKDMQKAAEKLNKAATAYLKYKLGPNMDRSTDGLTEYSKGRVSCAQQLLAATDKLKLIKGEELNAAQTNEREAKENLARRIGNKAEEKEYRNREKPAQQPVLS